MKTSDLRVRNYTEKDFSQLIEIQQECFPPPYPSEQLWNTDQLTSHITIFPQGAMCVEYQGQLLASCTSLIVEWHLEDADHSWAQTTDNGYIRTHNPNGNSLYGVDMAVKPAWRKQGISKLLYQARFQLVQELKLQRFLAAGRMPGYHQYQKFMSPEDYVQNVIGNKLIDPVLTPQLKAGLKPIKIIHHYLPDEESTNCALLFEWSNPERTRHD